MCGGPLTVLIVASEPLGEPPPAEDDSSSGVNTTGWPEITASAPTARHAGISLPLAAPLSVTQPGTNRRILRQSQSAGEGAQWQLSPITIPPPMVPRRVRPGCLPVNLTLEVASQGVAASIMMAILSWQATRHSHCTEQPQQPQVLPLAACQ